MRCTPRNASDEAQFLSFGPSLLLALAPKQSNLPLTPLESTWAQDYGTAYNIFKQVGGHQPFGRIDLTESEHFVVYSLISAPLERVKGFWQGHSSYRLYLACKWCLFRAVLDPDDMVDWLDCMKVLFKRFNRKKWGTGSPDLDRELIKLMDLRTEMLELSGTEWQQEGLMCRDAVLRLY
ncbi:MAG: hypothetical protein Q9168_006665 [Polycauliona sp. 1 TL-2023]